MLLIDLPTNEHEPVAWLLWDREQRRPEAQGQLPGMGALTELRDYSRQYSTYVLVPGECVSSFEVTLPTSGATALAALPYQIEEQLCADVSSLHFASARLQAHQPARVAVVDRELMQRWHAALHDAGLRIEAMAPDFLFLPPATLLVGDSRAVVTCGAHAAAIDVATLPVWWSLSGCEAAETVVCVRDQAPAWLPQASATDTADSRLQAVAERFNAPPFSLLQGVFALSEPWREQLALFRKPAIVLGIAIVLYFAMVGSEIFQASREVQALDAAIERVYRAAFPEARRIINPKAQMQSQLQQMESANSSGPLMPWLEKTASAVKGRPGVSVSQLTYQQQPATLRLSVSARDYSTLDQFIQALTAGGLRVERGSFSQQAQGISGQLAITEGGE